MDMTTFLSATISVTMSRSSSRADSTSSRDSSSSRESCVLIARRAPSIGAQIVSVPMALAVANANRAFYTFMISLATVFVVLFIILNIMLSLLIVRPIRRMSAAGTDETDSAHAGV